MTLTVYVSGSSTDLPRAEAAIAAIRKAGLRVAYDWPLAMRVHASIDMTDSMRDEIANGEIRAAAKCNVFWLLGPASFGSGVEYHAALASLSSMPKLVSSGTEHDIFRCDHHFTTDAEALAWIVAWAGAQ
jgi:hypothetical protein